MKEVKVAGATLYDMENVLVVVPDGLESALEDPDIRIECSPWEEGGPPTWRPADWLYNYGLADASTYCCGGVQEFKTKSGRGAVRILPGNTHYLFTYSGTGDRSWNNWEDRHPVGDAWAHAVSCSRGGGNWFEVVVLPKDRSQVKQADQARYEEDLAI